MIASARDDVAACSENVRLRKRCPSRSLVKSLHCGCSSARLLRMEESYGFDKDDGLNRSCMAIMAARAMNLKRESSKKKINGPRSILDVAVTIYRMLQVKK